MYLISVIVSLIYERKYKNDNHVSQRVVGTIINSTITADNVMIRNPLENKDIVCCFLYNKIKDQNLFQKFWNN